MLGAVDGFASAQTVGIVGIADGVGAAGGGGKLTALLPAKTPPGAVVVVGGIADGIVSEVFAVHSGEQVGPGAVDVGVGFAIAYVGNLKRLQTSKYKAHSSISKHVNVIIPKTSIGMPYVTIKLLKRCTKKKADKP